MNEAGPDKILLGRVITLDDASQIAEAVAIKGDRISMVGARADVLAQKGPHTEIVDTCPSSGFLGQQAA